MKRLVRKIVRRFGRQSKSSDPRVQKYFDLIAEEKIPCGPVYGHLSPRQREGEQDALTYVPGIH